MSNWSFYSLIAAATSACAAMLCLLLTMLGVAEPETTKQPLMTFGALAGLIFVFHKLSMRKTS